MKARINGHELGIEILAGRGPSLMLLHGLGLDRSIWKKMAEDHLRGYRVILPDVSGHGESPALGEVARIDGMAEDMLRLLDYLEIERAVVGGHSMGGYVALAMACQHGDRLAGLGLITSRAAADTPDQRSARYQTIREVETRGSIVLAESLAPRLSHDEDVQKQSFTIIERTNKIGLMGALQALAERPDRLQFLSDIRIPTFIVAGAEDQIVPLTEALEMTRLLPNCTYLEIPKAGHMPMLETPDILGVGLRGFMETCFP